MGGIQESSSVFSAISSLFSSYGPAVLNGLIVVSTIGGQSLIKQLTFTCPCSYPLNVYQSLFFLFGPSLALFLFGVLVNQNTWRLVHGCCFRVSSAYHPLPTILLYWSQIIGQALIAPVAWLFVALLDGGYYTCLRAGEFCLTSNCTNQQAGGGGGQVCRPFVPMPIANLSPPLHLHIPLNCATCICSLDPVSLGYLQSQSQVLAWILLVAVGFIALFMICSIRMCDRYTYVQSNYVKIYRETEKRVFEEMAREMASSTAQKNSLAFFGKQRLLKEDWDWLSSLPSLEDPFMFAKHFRGGDRVWPENWGDNYTTLQRWTQQRRVSGGQQHRNGLEVGNGGQMNGTENTTN